MTASLNYALDLPDEGQLRARFSDAIETWRDDNLLVDEFRKALVGQNPIEAPVTAAYKIKKSHAYHLAAAVNEKESRFLDMPRIKVVPAGFGERAQAESTRIEKWATTATEEIERNNPGVHSSMVRDQILFGRAVSRVERAPAAFWPEMVIKGEDGKTNFERMYEDPTAYEKASEDYKRRAGIPIRRVYVPVESFLPILEGPTTVESFELEQRSLRSVRSNKMFDTSGLPDFDTGSGFKQNVIILHYANQDYYAYYALGPGTREYRKWPGADSPESMKGGTPILLHAYRHGLGRVPYNMVAGRGSGWRAQNRSETEYVMRAILDLNQNLDEINSQIHTAARAMGWPTPVLYLDQSLRGADDAIPKPPNVQEGQPLTLWSTEKVGRLFEDQRLELLENQYKRLADRMSHLIGSSILFGERQPGVEAGYHANVLVTQSEHLDAKLDQNVARGHEDYVRLIFEHVAAMDEPTPVSYVEKNARGQRAGQWVSLKPSDVSPMPIIEARVRGQRPMDYPAAIQSFLNATRPANGPGTQAMSTVTARGDILNMEAPEEEEWRIYEEDERQKAVATGVLSDLIVEKLRLKLVKESTPAVSAQQVAGADPALQGAGAELATNGELAAAGGLSPDMALAQVDGGAAQQYNPTPESMINGTGGGTPMGLPQPQNILGQQAARGPM